MILAMNWRKIPHIENREKICIAEKVRYDIELLAIEVGNKFSASRAHNRLQSPSVGASGSPFAPKQNLPAFIGVSFPRLTKNVSTANEWWSDC